MLAENISAVDIPRLSFINFEGLRLHKFISEFWIEVRLRINAVQDVIRKGINIGYPGYHQFRKAKF